MDKKEHFSYIDSMTKNSFDRSVFVARRAFRSPRRLCTRADVVEAFGLSTTMASLALKDATEGFPQLRRSHSGVHADPAAPVPEQCAQTDLLEQMASGQMAFSETGLRFTELPTYPMMWSKPDLVHPTLLQQIIDAIGARRTLRLRYVSLTVGDSGKTRWAAPVGFTQSNSGPALLARDLERADFGERSFVLARITSVSDGGSAPRAFVWPSPYGITARVAVTHHAIATDAQRQALERQFKVSWDGVIEMDRRLVHDFIRQFSGPISQANLLWPPFATATHLG